MAFVNALVTFSVARDTHGFSVSTSPPSMRNDTRLSRMLHVLIHMARHEGPATSEAIGQMLGTNPVVVRRTMALLKNEGYVSSEKGHRGGWRLAKPLADITLLDIHQARVLDLRHRPVYRSSGMPGRAGGQRSARRGVRGGAGVAPGAPGERHAGAVGERVRAPLSALLRRLEGPFGHRRRACGGTPAVRDQSEYFTVNIRLRGSP